MAANDVNKEMKRHIDHYGPSHNISNGRAQAGIFCSASWSHKFKLLILTVTFFANCGEFNLGTYVFLLMVGMGVVPRR